MFVSDLHNDTHLFQNILNFFYQNIALKKIHYLIFLGDVIDRRGSYFDILKSLYSLKYEFPDNVFFLIGNHECDFRDIFFSVQPQFKNYLKYFSETSLILEHNEKKIFCSHGGIPIYKNKQNKYISCLDKISYDLGCIYNFNDFSEDNVDLKEAFTANDTFRVYGDIIPYLVEIYFLKKFNMDYCISGHVHKNQMAFDKFGYLRHVTICSSKKIRNGENIPTAYVIYPDGESRFINLEDFSDNKFIIKHFLE